MIDLVRAAIEELCASFERGGYNPTPIIDLGVLVVNADGKVTDRERETLKEMFQALLEAKLTADVVDHLVTASLDVIRAAGADARARLIGSILHDCDAGEAGVVVALAVAFASEGLSAAERAAVDRVAAAADVPPERVASLVEKVRKHFDGDPSSIRNILASGQTRRHEPEPEDA